MKYSPLACLIICLAPLGAHATPTAEPAKMHRKMHQCASTKFYKSAMKNMHRSMMIDYTGNTDVDFARGMIPHHQGALDMIDVQLKYGKDPELLALASNMKRWQQTEIGMMKQWLEGRNSKSMVENASTALYRNSMKTMHHAMMVKYSGNADIDFARSMIPHHQGAIEMANTEIRYGTSPEIRKLAWDITRSQQQEIKVMQEWLEKYRAGKK